MRVAVFGAGLVGRRTAELLVHAHAPSPLEVTLVAQKRDVRPISGVHTARGWSPERVADADVVVLATEARHQFMLAKELVSHGAHVITTADDPTQVQRLWTLDSLARASGASLGVGIAYSPGVSSLLVAHLAGTLDEVSAITTAQFGTGGPACAREHHRAMSAMSSHVNNGTLRHVPPGTGRQLVWFPEPTGAADCFRAGLAEPFLLHQAFPNVPRIEAVQAATRRDRLTARLPMLRPPHAEGLVGALWVEVRGRTQGRVEHRVMGATAPQATGAAALAAAVAQQLLRGAEMANAGNGDRRDDELGGGIGRGVWSAASAADPGALLQLVSNEVRLWAYRGASAVTKVVQTSQRPAARKWRFPRRYG